ncbi:hypothetical protein QQ056_13005 [Oscillatoria laete-virens NRMC-F 0139]|nr:hypothetical protein [Oscillatoria laete-virens]MDL5054458.1 hypothetical protein [Oscillatoria laete-virens NRMC-F 0139]
MIKTLAVIEMILSLALIVAFAVLSQETEAAKLTRAMEATSKSLEEAAAVSLAAKDYYGNMSDSLQKTGEAMRDLAPTVKTFGEKISTAGTMMQGLKLPVNITLEGFKPVLEFAQPFSTNAMAEVGTSFIKVGESLESSGPQLLKMSEDAPRISASLQEVHDQLLVASKELKVPVQGQSTIFYVGIGAGILLFLQSLTLFLVARKLP